MITGIGKKLVVDRGGFGYSSPVKSLVLANPYFGATEKRSVPKLMANQNGPERDCNLAPALTTNAKEARNG